MTRTKTRRLRFDRRRVIDRLSRLGNLREDLESMPDTDLGVLFTRETGRQFVEPPKPKYHVGDVVQTKRPVRYREGRRTYVLVRGAAWTVKRVRPPDEGTSGKPRYLLAINWRERWVSEGQIEGAIKRRA